MSGTISLNTQQTAFVQQYLPLAQSVSLQTGLSPYTVLGQAALETGWGASVAGNNFFGVSPGGSLATYTSPTASFQAYANLINASYAGAAAYTDPTDQALAIAQAGYGPAGGAAQYGSSLTAVVSELESAVPGLTNSTATLPPASAAVAGTQATSPALTIPGTTSGAPATVVPSTAAASATPSVGFYALAIVLIVGLVLFGLYGLVKQA